MKAPALFERYPQLTNLRVLVDDAFIEREIGERVEEFEGYLAGARELIPTVNLNQVFPEELERGTIQLENFLGHWGNVSIEELCKICLIIKWLRPAKILELGTYNGLTTLQMALNAPPECITYTLDLPEDDAPPQNLRKLDELVSGHFMGQFKTQIGSYFSQRGELNIIQLRGDARSFDYAKVGSSVDLILVDAAHDYESKKIDCHNAFRLLSHRGVILWHDYAQVACPEVTRCLAEYAADRPIFHLRRTNLAVYSAARYLPTTR